jgi:hypothetical protein
MAQDTAAVVVPGVGHFYIAPTSATKPTGTDAPTGDWEEIGYTTYEDPLTIEREGGESTVLPAWQAPGGLRTSTSPITYKVNFSLLQYDELSLQLYYGGGSVNGTTDEFEVPKSPSPQTRSLFIRVVDGSDVWARYFGTVDIIGSDDEELDPEALSFLPVSATVLEDPDLDYLFTIKGPSTVESSSSSSSSSP